MQEDTLDLLTDSSCSGKATRQSPVYCVLIPTLNEVENVDPLLELVTAEVNRIGVPAEIVVVDGGSKDDTCQRVKNWAEGSHHGVVRLVHSDARKGLSGDIIRGAAETQAEIVLVMDADLSHPPSAIEHLVRPLIENTHDLTIGSRYIPGGGTPGWPWYRQLTSRVAALLAWPLVNVEDPMSGFFCVRRQELLSLGRNASGFKIGLEVMVRGLDKLRTVEVPIQFQDRQRGQSKLGMGVISTYLKQLIALSGGSVSTGHAAKFGAVGAMGFLVDLTVFSLLWMLGASLVLTHSVSFLCATLFNFSLNSRWSFAGSADSNSASSWQRYLRFLVVCILALALRGAVLSSLVQDLHWYPHLALVAAVGTTILVNFFGSAFFVFPQSDSGRTAAVRWRVLATATIAYVLLLRLAFLGIIELMPQESYYWVYAQNLDIGYLDHPPMVAWLVALSTGLLGDGELTVRLPSLACWLISAGFTYQLTRNMFGKTQAILGVMLLSILPVYVFVGFMITPDSPLYAAWAGSLYFLERALLAKRPSAWYGLGVCIGLGMLSKYTIALLGPATLLFVILHRDSRRWLLSFHPYLAAALASILFSPVVFWNAQHDWASFQFQGTRRWSGQTEFSLPEMLFAVLLLLTPLGILSVCSSLRSFKNSGFQSSVTSRVDPRLLFARVFVVLPFGVFVIQSLRHNSQLNWTGPIWLAAIPILANNMAGGFNTAQHWINRLIDSLWKPSSSALLLFYGIGFYMIHLGLPGLPALSGMPLPIGWKPMAAEIEQLRSEVGGHPIIVGLDSYKIASAFSFYDPHGDASTHTSGSHLFDQESVMWRFWQPKEEAEGKSVMMISFKSEDLSNPKLNDHFESITEVSEYAIKREGRIVGRFYYRVGQQYRAALDSAPEQLQARSTASVSL